MNKSQLNQIIEEVTARILVGSVSISIEKMAEEIAKETVSRIATRLGACSIPKR